MTSLEGAVQVPQLTRSAHRPQIAVGAAVLAAVGALVAASVICTILGAALPARALVGGQQRWFWIQNATSAVIFVLPAAYLLRQRPGVPFGWLAAAAAVAHALAAAGQQYGVAGTVDGHHLPVAWLGLWFATWGPTVELPVLAAIYVLFPEGRAARGVVGTIGAVAVAVVTAGALAGMATPDLSPTLGGHDLVHVTNPIGIEGAAGLGGAGVLAPAMLVATLCVVLRWRAASGEERQVLAWLAGIAVPAALAAPAAGLGGAAGVVVAQVITLVEVAVITAAVLRHRVFGIVVVLNRTLVYAVLAGGVAILYGIVVDLGAATGAGRQGPSVAGALVAAFAVAPARGYVERAVNRFLYGERDEPQRVLSAVAGRLGAVEAAAELLPTFVHVAASSLRLPYVAVELSGTHSNRSFVTGQPPALTQRFALRHDNRVLGHLVVGVRSGQSELSAGEHRLLEDLAGQAAVAAATLLLTDDLVRSRERIVTAREEERRRLRRDLHDGLGPQLTGVALGLDLASEQLAGVAPAVATSVDSLRDEVSDAIVSIRRLVHDLRPPSLDERGLDGVITDIAERAGRAGLAVALELPERLPALPAAVEVAAFRIVSEAVNNVVRHAGAHNCRIAVEVSGALLSVSVADDGHGVAPDAVAGVGLGSMRERAEEVGGTYRLTSSAGGSRVDVELPIVAEHATSLVADTAAADA